MNKYLNSLVIIILMYFTIYSNGCNKKDHNNLQARLSPDWVKDAIIYEVYLRSFSKEGTFQALEKNIPSLKNLGVNVILLKPIHPIGELNRKGRLGNPYAAEDLYAVNPEFGTLQNFKSLVSTIHQQEMKIIIEIAAGHVAWDSRLLMEHPDWFKHNEEGAIVSPGPDLEDVAQLDYNHHETRKYMIAMMKYWAKEIDIDGFKCSGAGAIPIDFWEVVRGELDRIKPVILISEDEFLEYHINAFDLTCSWNVYHAWENIVYNNGSIAALDKSMRDEFSWFLKGTLRLHFNRAPDVYNKNVHASEASKMHSMKSAAVLTFTAPGIPLIYNGEEAGNRKYLNLYDKIDIDWSKGSDYRELYRKLCDIRRNHPALRYGSFVPVPDTESSNVYSFLRFFNSDSVLVIVNIAKNKKDVNLKLSPGLSGHWKDEFSNGSYNLSDSSMSIKLPPFGYAVLSTCTERKIK